MEELSCGALHINVMEHWTTVLSPGVFGDFFPAHFVGEWLDNEVARAVSISEKSSIAALREIVRRRQLAHRRLGWVCHQRRVTSEANGISDALSRNDMGRFRAELQERGLDVARARELVVPPELRDTKWLRALLDG